jgi:truncated hemoglobin YjbI
MTLPRRSRPRSRGPHPSGERRALRRAIGSHHAAGKDSYERLGGYDAIAAVTDDFIGRLIADPSIGRFFAPTARTRNAHPPAHRQFLCKNRRSVL